MYMHICTCIYIYMCVCVYVCTYTYVFIQSYICIYVYMYMLERRGGGVLPCSWRLARARRPVVDAAARVL